MHERRHDVAKMVVCAAMVAVGVAPAAAETGPSSDGYRRLAPGVLTVIPPGIGHDDTFSRHDVVDLLSVDPELGIAKDVVFRHDVWGLELSFKPLRMISVETTDAAGAAQSELVWYLVYRIRNLGDEPVRFIPTFVLEAQNRGVQYLDQLIPAAAQPIRLREDPRRQFLNSVDITGEIPPGEDGVWGVATWKGVDPTTDRLTISVGGLTNAYRWEDLPDGGRKYLRKVLVLKFWRPGDAIDEHENEIRFGAGEDRQPGDVDYVWVYR